MLKDSFGRRIEYLRISLTDKCNLRCRYCIPQEGVERLAHSEVLTVEEICRTARILTELGIKRIRLTGGEPLVRRGADTVIRELSELESKPELALTTNGLLLEDKLEEYYSLGLRSVNISLDTRRRDTYEKLTGIDGLDRVEAAIAKAVSTGYKVKINCVPILGVNNEELDKIAAYARDEETDVRFIELMPLGCAREYKGVSSEAVLGKLEEAFGSAIHLTEIDRQGPAEYVSFKDFKGRVGFISPISSCFCENCNRLRLTVDGKLKLCLFYTDSLDLKKLLRSGAGDDEIKEEIRQAVLNKPERHGFNSAVTDNMTERAMVQIGG